MCHRAPEIGRSPENPGKLNLTRSNREFPPRMIYRRSVSFWLKPGNEPLRCRTVNLLALSLNTLEQVFEYRTAGMPPRPISQFFDSNQMTVAVIS